MTTSGFLCVCVCGLALVLSGCAGGQTTEGGAAEGVVATKRPTYYGRSLDSQVRITTYDVYGTSIGEVVGTYVSPDVVAAQLSKIRGAQSAKLTPMDAANVYPVFGYDKYDFKEDIVLLRVGKVNHDANPLDTADVTSADTLFAISGKRGQLIKTSLVRTSRGLNAELVSGQGIFDPQGHTRGISLDGRRLVSSQVLDSLYRHRQEKMGAVSELRLKSGREYVSHTRVAGAQVVTTMGSFRIKLYDETPEYRDNFIRLVSDGYYDSLLVHRVLPSFLIQTGAADTRDCHPGETIGWKGPGYTLPIPERQKHYHRRGAVAASKLPEDRNAHNRCDGGQFYVVSGRTFGDKELDRIEHDYHKKFTSAQRETYRTVGGAPYLDGDYTVFGEVVEGMDVVDKISQVAVDGDRPKQDVRVLMVRLILKK